MAGGIKSSQFEGMVSIIAISGVDRVDILGKVKFEET